MPSIESHFDERHIVVQPNSVRELEKLFFHGGHLNPRFREAGSPEDSHQSLNPEKLVLPARPKNIGMTTPGLIETLAAADLPESTQLLHGQV